MIDDEKRKYFQVAERFLIIIQKVCIGAFILFFILGAYFFFKEKIYLSECHTTQGVITKVSIEREEEYTQYNLTIEFNTDSNKIRQVNYTENNSSLKKGDKIDILYRNGDDNIKIKDDFFSIWKGTFICFLMSFNSLISIIFIIALRWFDKKFLRLGSI